MTALAYNQSRNSSLQRVSARRLAYSILLRVESERAYASELLHSRLDASMDERDAALATELVMGTLRWRRLIDFFVERCAGRQTSSLDLEVLIVLRLGIYQLRHLTRIPPRAVVNEAVELAKHARKKSASSLVNAVLRKAADEREFPVANFLPRKADSADALALRYSHPTWLVERWLRNFGEQETLALLKSNNRPPEQACVFLNAAHRSDAIESLRKEGVTLAEGRLLRDAMIVRGGSLARASAFRNGWIGVQDEASQLLPLLLDVRRGESVLDLCAAPGGKTMTLARQVGGSGRVVAADVREARLRSMRARLERAGEHNISLVVLDGTSPLPFGCEFERILVDAPCSGTGTLARNPEIRWRLTLEDLADLHQRQAKLVRSALACLAPKGTLLYSTCSLEPEENESVMREMLDSGARLASEAIRIPGEKLAAGVKAERLATEGGAFRILPAWHGTDGFFAALIRRK